ncbi:hypothetical protein [Streptomyces sp. NPDC004976]
MCLACPNARIATGAGKLARMDGVTSLAALTRVAVTLATAVAGTFAVLVT